MKIALGIIVALIVILGGWYLFMGGSNPQLAADMPSAGTSTDTAASGQTSTTATQAAAPSGKGSGTLGSIYSRSGNYTCTFETLTSSVKTTGTIYVSGGKTRSDLRTSVAGTDTDVHSIIANSYNYLWVAGQPTGTKTYVGASTKPASNSTGAGFDGDANSQVSWDCHPWLPDASQFAPPTTITFVAR